MQKKLQGATKKFSTLQADETAHAHILSKLETDIQEYTETEQDLQTEYDAKKREGQQGTVTLTEEQEAEYEQLRETARVTSAKHRNTVEAVKSRVRTAKNIKAKVNEEIKDLTETRNEVLQRLHDYE